MDNHIYISQLSTSLFSYKLLIKIKKVDVKLNKTLKLKFISMFFDSVYPTRPSATVTNSIICPLFYWRKNYSNYLQSYFATQFYGQQNSAQKCLSFYFLRQNTCLSLFLKIQTDSKLNIQTAIFQWQQQQKSQKSENVRLWTSIFRYANLKIVLLIASELFNRIIDPLSDTFFLIS